MNKNKYLNQKFNKLTITGNIKYRGRVILRECKCDCGKITYSTIYELKAGHTKSCGCLRNEFRKLNYGEAAFNDLYADYERGAKIEILNLNYQKKNLNY